MHQRGFIWDFTDYVIANDRLKQKVCPYVPIINGMVTRPPLDLWSCIVGSVGLSLWESILLWWSSVLDELMVESSIDEETWDLRGKKEDENTMKNSGNIEKWMETSNMEGWGLLQLLFLKRN